MTIIKPNAYRKIKKTAIVLVSVSLSPLIFVVFLNIRNVDLRLDIAGAEIKLEDLKVENADLKSDFYSMMDSENLENLATERGLIKEKNPQWAFSSDS